MEWIEITATIFGIICVWLTIKQNIWCWPTGLIQVSLYTIVFYNVKLYSDLILHVIYIFLQIYGWYNWQRGGENKSKLKVTRLSQPVFIKWITIGILGTIGWGFIMANYTDAAIPYGDSFIISASLIAQWLMARKKLESWYFWISVDIIAIAIYWIKDLYYTTGLYSVFLVLAITGYFAWKKSYDGLKLEKVLANA